MRYNIGIIGTGKMGKNHIRVIKNMTDKFNIKGIYDVNLENAKVTSEQHGVEYYEDLEDLLNKIDAVILATPSSLHKNMSIKCIDKGINTFIEKPLALEVKDGEEIWNRVKNKNITCMVGHIERYNPVTSELLKILNLEEVLSIDIHRLSPFDKRIFDTDVALDLMIHDVDLLSTFINDEIIDIKSMGTNVYSNTYDYVQTLIKYKTDIQASLTASRITEDKKRMVEVNTKNAYIVADYLNRTIHITRKTKFSLDVGYATKYKQENIQEKVFVPMKEPLLAELEHFYDCILKNENPQTNIYNSLNVLRTCKKIVSNIGECL